MKESADHSGTSSDPFAEEFESEEAVQERWPNHPVRACFEARPTPQLLSLLFGDLPHPSVSDTAESDATEKEPEIRAEREAA